MKILITGGVGFIGTNAAIYFSKDKKNQIILVDNFSRNGVKINADFLKKNYPKIKIIRSSVIDIKNYQKEIINSDVIIHLAGQTAVTTSIKKPKYDFKNNLYESYTLLEYLRKINYQGTILYSSTNKVYGDLNHIKKNQYKPIDESEKLDFISPYGCSKGATDLYFLDYNRIYGMKTIVFRQSCIYGPHQFGVEDQGWVAHFSKQFIFKKPITIFGDGKQIRDLLYVEDLIKAYELAIKKIDTVKGQAFNIGGGIKNAYSLIEVIEFFEKKIGYKVKIIYKKMRIGDQKYFVSANKKIKKFLDWQPTVDFKNGIERLIDWQKENL